MKHDEIDRAMRKERTIEPSFGFSQRVMRGVRYEVEQREALRFPWRRLLPGLFLCLALISAAVVAVASGRVEPGSVWMPSRIDLSQPLMLAAVALLASLAGSYLVAAGALRVAGYRR